MMLFHLSFDFFSFRSPAMQLKKGFERAKNHEFSLQSKKFKPLLYYDGSKGFLFLPDPKGQQMPMLGTGFTGLVSIFCFRPTRFPFFGAENLAGLLVMP
ncbi:MAG: hypothetical protein AAFX53_03265 [Bacteroidota bacterium]